MDESSKDLKVQLSSRFTLPCGNADKQENYDQVIEKSIKRTETVQGLSVHGKRQVES